jgi:tRNA threonylcarbamoyladenosine biosynthesis protein TsaE
MIDIEIYFDFNEIEKTAKEFLKATSGYRVFAFSGDLGAGKTSFITALCKALHVSETVTSPTYSIIQEYATIDNKTIFHIDLYRIKSKEEAMDAGVEDCLLSNEICMVEWPEKAPDIFPGNTIYSDIEILSDTKRKMIIKFPV